MKLKLENQEKATILLVSDTIEASHLPVLKAGLTKLFQAGKKAILLDFTGLTEKDFKEASLIPQIADLKAWAAASGAQIVVVSGIAKMAHAPTRADGLNLLIDTPSAAPAAATAAPVAAAPAPAASTPPPAIPSADAPPAEQEASLTATLKQLEAKKAELEKKLGGGSTDADFKKLQLQNSLLKKHIAAAEKVARKQLKLRTKEPISAAAQQAAQDNLNKLVDSFLSTEGLLK